MWRFVEVFKRCAPVPSAPAGGYVAPAKLSRVPPPSRAHPQAPRPLSGQARGGVSGFLPSLPQRQTGLSARTRPELEPIIDYNDNETPRIVSSAHRTKRQ